MAPIDKLRLIVAMVIGLVIIWMIFDLWHSMWYKPYKRSKEWEQVQRLRSKWERRRR
jgi:hypothetical protein